MTSACPTEKLHEFTANVIGGTTWIGSSYMVLLPVWSNISF